MDRIGVVDTMFARYDMGAEAVDELRSCPGFGSTFEVGASDGARASRTWPSPASS